MATVILYFYIHVNTIDRLYDDDLIKSKMVRGDYNNTRPSVTILQYL